MDVLDLVNKGKIKRLFRARQKLSFPGAICHITQRAAGKEPLFVEEGDYLFMLYLTKEIKKEFSFEVFCHCLMPNHLHLLIRLSEDNLSKAMKQLYGEYARFFNKKYERKGHVFGGAFRQALCFDENYLLAASLYIHLNPVRANLSKDPAKYRWSSCKLYVEPFEGETFVDYKFILEILGNDFEQGRKSYFQMLKEARTIKTYEVWENCRALESFYNKTRNFLSSVAGLKGKELDGGFLGAEALEKKISELKLKGRLRFPENLKARKFLIEQLRARGYANGEIAEKLNISRQAIYKKDKIDIVKSVKLRGNN
ncbi:MAG: transposase [Candidatus Omnitrophota bacterium]